MDINNELRTKVEVISSKVNKLLADLINREHGIIEAEKNVKSLLIEKKEISFDKDKSINSQSRIDEINESIVSIKNKIKEDKASLKSFRKECVEITKNDFAALFSEIETSYSKSEIKEVKTLYKRMISKLTKKTLLGVVSKKIMAAFSLNKYKVVEKKDVFEKEVLKRQEYIKELRLEGSSKIEDLKNENINIRKNKMLDKLTKAKLINSNKAEIKKAKIVKSLNAYELTDFVIDTIMYISFNYNAYFKEKTAQNKDEIKVIKSNLKEDILKENEEYKLKLNKENERFINESGKDASKEDIKKHRVELADIKFAHKQNINDLNSVTNDKINKLKDEAYLLKNDEYNEIEKANDKRLPLNYNYQKKFTDYKNSFDLRSFILRNGLYIAIILLFVVAIIYYAVQTGMFLFEGSTIFLILNQVAPKMFLALGVGGLIVLAGTDLSIGRLVGLAAVLTGMFVVPGGITSVKFFGNEVTFFEGWPLGLRVVIGFALAIVACSCITSIAGFFTAKFKMHPFISTLAMQLFTFGIFAGITANSFTGNPDETVVKYVSGYIGDSQISPMIIYAIIGIIIMWFIWNKTKFGKNMFAVGGNSEAASVSGINVFWITMGVFILAGIYYGIGGSIYGIYSGNVRAQTGQGMEADAIAACVVGGVSFSGGVGKISGVVTGAILFQAITVVLPYIGITDANYQLAIKGIIILAAVALDCAKYLKKK